MKPEFDPLAGAELGTDHMPALTIVKHVHALTIPSKAAIIPRQVEVILPDGTSIQVSDSKARKMGFNVAYEQGLVSDYAAKKIDEYLQS